MPSTPPTSELELTQVIETIPGFVWRALPNGQLTYVNQRLFDYIGVRADSLWGEGWADFVHPDDRPGAIGAWSRSVATGDPLENHYRLRRADGVYRWFHVPGQLGRDADGRPTQWYGLLVDDDERRSAEEALRRTETRLTRAAATATVGELAASIAHEVNQPLAAVVAHAQACVRWLSAEPAKLQMARQSAERIIRDGMDASAVVQRVRALFRRSEPETTSLNINDVIREVLSLLGREASRRQVAVERHLATELQHVVGDRMQLQQVLFNLIINAMEAMEFNAHRKRVLRVSSRHDGPNNLVVTVRDTGVGLAEPERIFDPFYSTKPGGMGMGLSICRSIVEAHHGTLWAASDGSGATFHLTLPLERSE